MPLGGETAAILETYLSGQAAGEAAVNILYGRTNPSGHLTETLPLKLEDNPSHLAFPGEGARVKYQEGLFIGYRYYTSKQQKVLFPFGHGLSYTRFSYHDLELDKTSMTEDEELKSLLKELR